MAMLRNWTSPFARKVKGFWVYFWDLQHWEEVHMHDRSSRPIHCPYLASRLLYLSCAAQSDVWHLLRHSLKPQEIAEVTFLAIATGCCYAIA